jgi:hypothetical protein
MRAHATERHTLQAGVREIEPLLAAHGFAGVGGDDGVSSGGSYATSLFRRGELEIGLIVRQKIELGCPSYTEGQGYAGHNDLIRRLGCEGLEELVEGEFLSWKSKSGGSPFVALKADLERIVLPALVKSEADFRRALREAHGDFMRTLGIKK